MKKAQKLCRNAAEQLRVAYSDWCHLQQCAIYHNKVFVCGSYYGYFTVQNSTYKCIHKQVDIHKHPFKRPLSRTTRASRYQKSVKPIWILLKQEIVSGSGISCHKICKSALCSREITMPAPHHSVFYRPDALPAAQPTASKHTHTHTRLTALFPGLPGWAGTRKVKPIRILLKQETVSGSGISWAICKSAPRCRQITTPAPHHSVFSQAGCPSCHPTNSVKALKSLFLYIDC